jgi:hypothetical protein
LDRQGPRDSLLASIDRGLSAFGASVPIVVYFELKKSFGISRVEIPQHPELFVKTIENLFGVGVDVVRRAIRKELEASSGIKDLSDVDLATAMRRAYHKRLEQTI